MRDPAPGRWTTALSVEYGSLIEYNRLDQADYVLDSEVLRMGLTASHDIGRSAFVQLTGSVGGAYSGFLDGFLDWYHGALGIEMSERERRPHDRFLYSITLPDGLNVRRSQNSLFLGDMSIGLGIRHAPGMQSVLSVTLPTATGPSGYGKSVPSIALLNTLRAPITPRLTYEGSLGVGITPTSRPTLGLAAHYLSGPQLGGAPAYLGRAIPLCEPVLPFTLLQRDQPAGARPPGALPGLWLDSGDTRWRRVADGAD